MLAKQCEQPIASASDKAGSGIAELIESRAMRFYGDGFDHLEYSNAG